MTSPVAPLALPRSNVRTIVGGGITLGLAAVVGVVTFAWLSRTLAGRAEVMGQTLVVLGGGAVAAYLPSYWVRPREIDGIGWSCLLAVVGFVVFTIVDTVILRPLDLYHWTWDAIGGGSGWWYLPIWLMGTALLAWLGGVVHSLRARREHEPALLPLAGQTIGIALGLFVLLAATGLTPFHAGAAALAFTLALGIHIPVAMALARR